LEVYLERGRLGCGKKIGERVEFVWEMGKERGGGVGVWEW
jgi:hypothetical protein